MVDIDGCFTNELPMPKLPNEMEQIRILNVSHVSFPHTLLDLQEFKDTLLRPCLLEPAEPARQPVQWGHPAGYQWALLEWK